MPTANKIRSVLESKTKILLLFLVLGYTFEMNSQNEPSSTEVYFNRIEELIEQKNRYPIDFLDTNFLFMAKNKASGEKKVSILLKLYTAFVFTSWETAKKYNDEACKLSVQLNYKKGELQSNYNHAYLLFVKGDFEGSMLLAEKLSLLTEIETYPEIYADINTLKCDIYTEKGQYDIALELGMKLLDSAEKSQNDHMLMKANAALSHTYLRMGNFMAARDYCLKGLDYIIKLKRTEYIYPKINEIARMTAKLEGPEHAMQVMNFFSEIEQKIPPPGDYVRSITYMIHADIFMAVGELDKAQSNLTKALDMCFKNNFRFRIPRAFVQQA
ncbi:MAG: hypothetical protein AAF361_07280, partial [Bacteroidota bacterium]